MKDIWIRDKGRWDTASNEPSYARTREGAAELVVGSVEAQRTKDSHIIAVAVHPARELRIKMVRLLGFRLRKVYLSNVDLMYRNRAVKPF